MKKWSRAVLLCVLMVGTVIYFEKTAPISDDLIGVWITPSPEYAERFFKITKDLLFFGNGKILSDYGIISKVNKAVQDKNILYTIYYTSDQGVEQQFSFFYDLMDGGTIRFKNQKQIEWTKLKGDSDDWLLKHWQKNGVMTLKTNSEHAGR